VSVRLALLSVALIVASLAIAVWAFGLSLGRAVLLAPVFVLTAGGVAAFFVIVAKIVRER
jgi:hypothetical protein